MRGIQINNEATCLAFPHNHGLCVETNGWIDG